MFYTMADAAKFTGVDYSAWRRGAFRGEIPGPTHPGPDSRWKYYTQEEVDFCRDKLANRQPPGTMTLRAASETLGVSYEYLRFLCWTRSIGTEYRRRKYITNADLVKLNKYLGVA